MCVSNNIQIIYVLIYIYMYVCMYVCMYVKSTIFYTAYEFDMNELDDFKQYWVEVK
ncbi:MAG: hypothetical protein NW900_01545 [Candidatus Blochmannia sp. A2]|nr:hypothetical protein [Candidatus Blochmannia sp. A2]